MLDQARVIEGEAGTQLALKNRLQLAGVHFAVSANGLTQFFWCDLRRFAWREINRAGGKIDTKGD